MMGSLTILRVERLTCSGELGAWGEGGSMCLGELAQVRDSGGGGGGGLGFTYAGGSGVHMFKGILGAGCSHTCSRGWGSHVLGGWGITCSRGWGSHVLGGLGVHMFKGLGFTCSGGAGGSHVQGVGVHMFWGGWGFTCSGGLGVRRWSIQVHVFM